MFACCVIEQPNRFQLESVIHNYQVKKRLSRAECLMALCSNTSQTWFIKKQQVTTLSQSRCKVIRHSYISLALAVPHKTSQDLYGRRQYNRNNTICSFLLLFGLIKDKSIQTKKQQQQQPEKKARNNDSLTFIYITTICDTKCCASCCCCCCSWCCFRCCSL